MAVDLSLAPDDIAALDALFPLGAAVGERYNEQMAQWVDRTTLTDLPRVVSARR